MVYEREGPLVDGGKETDRRDSSRTGKRPLLKGAILVAFLVAAVAAARFTPIQGYLAPSGLGRFLSMAGIWGPVIFTLVYAAGVCLFIPGTLLTTPGAAIFGAYLGFLHVWVGAMLGARVALVERHLLGGVIHPYPTQADAVRQVAGPYNRTRRTPFVRKLLAWWLKWTG